MYRWSQQGIGLRAHWRDSLLKAAWKRCSKTSFKRSLEKICELGTRVIVCGILDSFRRCEKFRLTNTVEEYIIIRTNNRNSSKLLTVFWHFRQFSPLSTRLRPRTDPADRISDKYRQYSLVQSGLLCRVSWYDCAKQWHIRKGVGGG